MSSRSYVYRFFKKIIGVITISLLAFSLGMLLPIDSFPQRSFADTDASTAGFGPATSITAGFSSNGQVTAGFEQAKGFGPAPVTKCQKLASGAKCQSVSNACAGGYIDNFCPGNASIRCCLPVRSACQKKGGKCVTVNGSQVKGKKGTFISGLCPGPTNIKCFVPKK